MMGIFKIFSSESPLDGSQMSLNQPSEEQKPLLNSLTTSCSTISPSPVPSVIEDDGKKGLQTNNPNNTILPNAYPIKGINSAECDISNETPSDAAASDTPSRIVELEDKLLKHEMREQMLMNEIELERAGAQQTGEIIKDFEALLNNVLKDRDKLEEHKSIALTHLANIEHAFSDVNTKYERSKRVVEQFRENEEVLKNALHNAEVLLKYRENKYQTLKKHASEKLQEANVELDKMRKAQAVELAKFNGMIKKSEYKIKCLEQQLDQKVSENTQMARLWEDLNNNIHSEGFETDSSCA